jgi:membrane protein
MPKPPRTNPSEPKPSTAEGGSDTPKDWRKDAHRILVVTRIGIIGLYESQLPRMAAALAFRTIFSIIPVMAIGLLIFGSIVSEDQVESGVRRVLSFSGVSQISTPDQSTNQPTSPTTNQPTGQPNSQPNSQPLPTQQDAQGTDLPNPQSSAIQKPVPGTTASASPPAAPFAGTDLEELITDLINRVNTSIRNVPTGWIALTSGLVLLYAAMSMLIEIEKSFNQLCGAPGGRPWLRRIMLYWTILTAGSLLLAATFLAGDAFTKWVISIAGQESLVGAVMAGYGVSVLISTILLVGAYTTIPNTRIHFRSALAGAFFAAVLWELGKLGFTTYLRYTTTYAKFYGSIAILPLFLLWIYLTWLIVLFGIQASYALQNFSRLVESKLNARTGQTSSRQPLLDPLVALSVAHAIQAAFELGKPITADDVADQTRLQPTQANEVVAMLHRSGFIHRVDRGDRDDAWTPARPAEQINLDDILRSAQELDAFRSSAARDMLPESITGATVGSCSGMSLAQLMQQTAPAPQPDQASAQAPQTPQS